MVYVLGGVLLVELIVALYLLEACDFSLPTAARSSFRPACFR